MVPLLDDRQQDQVAWMIRGLLQFDGDQPDIFDRPGLWGERLPEKKT
jgi:hypothetical protein